MSNISPPEFYSTTNINFKREIESMMHAFGDCSTPLPSSVSLVEKVVCQQMLSLMHQAEDVAMMRGAKSIGAEDFLFLMRKDRVKITRLLNYLSVKEKKPAFTSTLFNAEMLDSKGEFTDSPGKLRKRCINFLKSIDQTGELTDKHCQPFDAIKHERNVRAELMSQNLDENGYLEYSQARQVSFINRFSNGNSKLCMWLKSKSNTLPELPKSSTLEYEVMCYMAYEIVAQLVDLALLVRQDAAVKPGDAFSYHVAGFTRKPGIYPPQQNSELPQVGSIPPLTPAEIREGLRRYWSPQATPFPGNNDRLLPC